MLKSVLHIQRKEKKPPFSMASSNSYWWNCYIIFLWTFQPIWLFFASSNANFEGRPFVVAPLCVMRSLLPFSSQRFPLSWFWSALRAFLRIPLVSWHRHSWRCVYRWLSVWTVPRRGGRLSSSRNPYHSFLQRCRYWGLVKPSSKRAMTYNYSHYDCECLFSIIFNQSAYRAFWIAQTELHLR